jgi:hypothetical protein
MGREQEIEQAEQWLGKLMNGFENRSRNDHEFGATRMNAILDCNEAERMALIVMALKEICTEVGELRREVETIRASKAKSADAASRQTVRRSLTAAMGLEKRVVRKEPEEEQRSSVAEPEPVPEFIYVPSEGRLVAGDRVMLFQDRANLATILSFARDRFGIKVLVRCDTEPNDPPRLVAAEAVRRAPIQNPTPRYAEPLMKRAR